MGAAESYNGDSPSRSGPHSRQHYRSYSSCHPDPSYTPGGGYDRHSAPYSQPRLSPYYPAPDYSLGSSHTHHGPAATPLSRNHDCSRGSISSRPSSADPDPFDYADIGEGEKTRRERGNRSEERGLHGLGATVLGTSVGAALGPKLGNGRLGTSFGGAVGALSANLVEDKVQDHSKHRHQQYHGRQTNHYSNSFSGHGDSSSLTGGNHRGGNRRDRLHRHRHHCDYN